MKIKEILHHYLVAALWTAELDMKYTVNDIDKTSIERAKNDIKLFTDKNEKTLLASGLSAEQIGHDFWLTRNHHGTGFWDRNIGQAGKELTASSHDFKEMNVLDEDGKVYIE